MGVGVHKYASLETLIAIVTTWLETNDKPTDIRSFGQWLEANAGVQYRGPDHLLHLYDVKTALITINPEKKVLESKDVYTRVGIPARADLSFQG